MYVIVIDEILPWGTEAHASLHLQWKYHGPRNYSVNNLARE